MHNCLPGKLNAFYNISFQEAIKASLCGSDLDDSTNDTKPQAESGGNPCQPCGSNQRDTIATTVNRRDGQTSLSRSLPNFAPSTRMATPHE